MKHDARQQAEFLQMLRQCEGTLVRVCLFFTDRSDDDFHDLYQDIVCNLWESWPGFRGESALLTWVTRIALNVAGKELHKRKRRQDFVRFDRNIHDTIADEATDLRIQPLYRIIDKLEDDFDRKLLFLYLDRHPLCEIAQMTDLSEAAVKQRLYRIKQQLKIIQQKYYENE
ncbi:MAG: sigma-70 family RNA polymerase sigma factor [Bacteroidales bacterium]|nr:sigma-70 family RNA polymerase sigma factor [Candidatus Colimorpha pelethequi]